VSRDAPTPATSSLHDVTLAADDVSLLRDVLLTVERRLLAGEQTAACQAFRDAVGDLLELLHAVAAAQRREPARPPTPLALAVTPAARAMVAEAVARWDTWQPDAADGDVAAHRERQERRLRLDRLGAQFALR
jgi:hypothetical protein